VAAPALHTDTAPGVGNFSLRKLAAMVAASALLVVGLVVIAPAIGDLPDVWQRLAHGDMSWLALAAVLESLSFVGHIILFRAVSLDGGGRIGMRREHRDHARAATWPRACSRRAAPAASR